VDALLDEANDPYWDNLQDGGLVSRLVDALRELRAEVERLQGQVRLQDLNDLPAIKHENERLQAALEGDSS
jgi:hypothetical protein